MKPNIFKPLFLLLALIVMSGNVVSAKETAETLLDRAAANVRNAKSVKADYTIISDGHKQNGVLTICGDRFTISSPQISSWYDGRTQWTYSTQTGEVNITEPTPDELQQVNPFAIINSFRKTYKATLLNSPAGVKKIKLDALNSANDIRSVVLTLDAAKLQPSEIDLTLGNRRTVKIKINSMTSGNVLPVSAFRFDPKAHPGILVVDLR